MIGSDSKRSEASLLLDRGLVRYALGARDEAISLWEQALALEPDSDRAKDYLRSVGAIPSGGTEDEMPVVAEPAPADPPTLERASQDSLVPPFTQEVAAYAAGELDSDDLDVEPVVPDVDIMVRDALQDEAEGRLEEALKLAQEAIKRDPDHDQANRMVKDLRQRLATAYLEELEPVERIPFLRATDASILELSLDPIGGFLISQIDGEITIEELLTILGTFDRFRVLSSLHFFLENGIIELR